MLVTIPIGTPAKFGLPAPFASSCAGSGLISASLSDDGRQVESVRRLYDTESSNASGVLEITQRHCLDDVSNNYLRCGNEERAVQD